MGVATLLVGVGFLFQGVKIHGPLDLIGAWAIVFAGASVAMVASTDIRHQDWQFSIGFLVAAWAARGAAWALDGFSRGYEWIDVGRIVMPFIITWAVYWLADKWALPLLAKEVRP